MILGVGALYMQQMGGIKYVSVVAKRCVKALTKVPARMVTTCPLFCRIMSA
jgi:hypothetical protein